jgi:signal transduction histidine kinase/ActR/RegA family two-component response regulator
MAGAIFDASADRSRVAIPVAAAIITMLAGATGLAGWMFGVEALKSIVGTVTMKANMAVGLVACGASLALTVAASSRLKAVAVALAAFAGTVGALTLSEHLFGWTLGIDELLFTETPGAAATTSPGRMGPNGATSLVLAGIALVLLARDRGIRRSQILAASMAILATIPLAGYAYGAAELYNIARYTGIAFSTAVTLLTLSIGILTARPGSGLIAVFSAGGPGGVLARWLLLPAIVLPLVLGYLRVLGQNAGLYDTGLGTALLAIALATIFVSLVCRTAVQLDAIDAERQRAERERTDLLERERRARAEVEQANRLKDHFLATLSHELRTPLNAILGYARMLRTGAISDEKRPRAIEIIERNAVAQNQLVDDLLDMSRMTTGRIRLDRHVVPIIAPLQEAIESVRPMAEAKGIAFDVETDPFAGNVHGDDGRLRQVFWNILSNAVKFTAPGGRVSVGLDASGDSTRVTVRDGGSGIDPAFLPHIFEPFRQGDGGSTRIYSGLGLGLAICKQLVELHGGSIIADSAGVDRGATFIVQLPRHVAGPGDGDALRESTPLALSRPSASSSPRPLAGRAVLVVDDEQDSLDLSRQLLENAGATVRTASNAAEALREFDGCTPDLLIADIAMPQVDGYELLRQIRTRRNGITLPAVAVTAYARSDDRLRALAAGFQHHIPKPIDPNVYIETIVSALPQQVSRHP